MTEYLLTVLLGFIVGFALAATKKHFYTRWLEAKLADARIRIEGLERYRKLSIGRGQQIANSIIKVANLKDRIVELEATIDDWQESSRIVLEEKCADDEVHCTCVPALRIRIKTLEANISKSALRGIAAQLEKS